MIMLPVRLNLVDDEDQVHVRIHALSATSPGTHQADCDDIWRRVRPLRGSSQQLG